MFSSTLNKGFQMTFQNGWTISVQFGYSSYCQNYHHPEGVGFSREGIVKSQDAEIAIWDKEGQYYNFGNDTVKGWCSSNEAAEWIEKVSKW